MIAKCDWCGKKFYKRESKIGNYCNHEKCHNEYIRVRRSLYYEHEAKYRKEWKINNREKYIEQKHKHRRRGRENLSNWYIKELLTKRTDLKAKDISLELIELKKLDLTLKREARRRNHGRNP